MRVVCIGGMSSCAAVGAKVTAAAIAGVRTSIRCVDRTILHFCCIHSTGVAQRCIGISIRCVDRMAVHWHCQCRLAECRCRRHHRTRPLSCCCCSPCWCLSSRIRNAVHAVRTNTSGIGTGTGSTTSAVGVRSNLCCIRGVW